MFTTLSPRAMRTVLVFLCLPLGAACQPASPPAGAATPVYNQTTGRLEQLIADRDADGRPDARAFMDGVSVTRVELDRNNDGAADRWEFYTTPEGAPRAGAPQPVITRAEEANGPDARITRRERYENGQLAATEEDTDFDGRVDKWETYVEGQLRYVDLDLEGTGVANRRLTYAPGGVVTSGPLPEKVQP
jgi:hypothetical protein